MSLFSSIAASIARGRVNGAREGKEGPEMQSVLKALDGYKRVILLLVYLIVEWVRSTGHGDYGSYVETVTKVLGWDAGMLPVPVSLIAGTVVTLHAIVDGIKKAQAAKVEAAKLVR